MKVTRLDDIVHLKETQRGQVFGIMARGARDFDPTMRFEGMGTETSGLPLGKSRPDSVLSVIRPDPLNTYETEQTKRGDDGRKEMESMGPNVSADWSSLDHLSISNL